MRLGIQYPTQVGVTTSPEVRAIALLPNGNILVGGGFTFVQGSGASQLLTPAIAEWSLALPTFATQPTDVETCPGTDVAFTVVTNLPPAETLQWRKDGFPIDIASNPTAGTSTLVLTSVQAVDEGRYECVATASCGMTMSFPADLTLKECSTGTCDDIDFNNDGLYPDTTDIDAFLSVFSGGGCF